MPSATVVNVSSLKFLLTGTQPFLKPPGPGEFKRNPDVAILIDETHAPVTPADCSQTFEEVIPFLVRWWHDNSAGRVDVSNEIFGAVWFRYRHRIRHGLIDIVVCDRAVHFLFPLLLPVHRISIRTRIDEHNQWQPQ